MNPIRKNNTTENIDKQHGTITPKNVFNVRRDFASSISIPLLLITSSLIASDGSMSNSVSESAILKRGMISEVDMREILRAVNGLIYNIVLSLQVDLAIALTKNIENE